ncbi:hypothetical protein MTO96_000915 [Rhipicephalus appendiculatus]
MLQRETTSSYCSTNPAALARITFPVEVEFTQLMARLLTVSPDFSRFAVVTYNSDNKLHFDHISRGGSTMCGFLSELEKIEYRGGRTNTREALEYANRLLQGGRSGANRIILLISDGRADRDSKPQGIAGELKRNGVVIFAVGVMSFNRTELEEVASSPAHIYMLTDIKQVSVDLLRDTNEIHWDRVDPSECLKEHGSCDVNAICGCGARGGSRRCICKEGYEGAGTNGTCRRCPRGSYKDEIGYGNCRACPDHSTSPDGANSLNQCFCIPGYNGNPGDKVPCIEIRCPVLNAPPNGNLNCSSNTFEIGTTCVVGCSVGHNLVGNPSVTCATNGTWTGQLPMCQEVRCPALSAPPNGNLNCSSNALKLGTTCAVECLVGHNLVGNPSVTCATNGTWIGQLPSCQEVRCPALNAPPNGNLNCSSNAFEIGTTCVVECLVGHILVGNASLTCVTNGTWLGLLPSCQEVRCPALNAPLNGNLNCSNNTFEIGTTCVVECSVGLSLVGNPSVTCATNGTWIGQLPTCQEVPCPAFNAPLNGNLNCYSNTLEIGTTCVVGCSVGHNLVGNPSVTCATNGTWIGQMPTCQAVMCPPLKRNKRMLVSPSRCLYESMPYGSTCTYTCAKGWRVVHRVTKTGVDGIRKCLENGKWQGADQKITCQDVEPPVIKNCPEDIEVNNAPHSPFSVPVMWDEPSAEDNSKYVSVKLISPNYLTKLPWEFPIGEHVIQYVAVDDAKLESTPCTFKLTVRDVEPPTLTNCPDDIVLFSASRKREVLWEEPTFTDNSGNVTITFDRQPGRFTWGPPSIVNYTARDTSGNTAYCSFKVIVKRK